MFQLEKCQQKSICEMPNIFKKGLFSHAALKINERDDPAYYLINVRKNKFSW